MIIGVWFMLCLALTIVLTTIYVNSWQNEDTELTFSDMVYVLISMLILYGLGCIIIVENGLLLF